MARLKRMYMCSDIAKQMTWHFEHQKDEYLRHPVDGSDWSNFDYIFPEFAKEPRNVRLGLSSDGFNPFRTMSISHSTWPVVLINYNLTPWSCMKSEYFMLALLIPGPDSPENNIDVYMRPLMEEWRELWINGVETYDKFRNQTFRMYAVLKWSISDYPALSMILGWKCKGYFGCPECNYGTSALYLKHSRKMCYMGHRRFLDTDHRYRFDETSFNGQCEHRPPPEPLSGFEVDELLKTFINKFGKTKKVRNDKDDPWKKRNIMFDLLPYWKFNTLPFNFDVMHIEKGICDNVLGTLLDILGKSKDHVNAHFDLLDLGIKDKL